MRIIFDPDFDAGFWPGPLRAHPGKTATAGEAWVGPQHLRGILETVLGLGGLFPSHSERTVSLARTIRTAQGFWSESAKKDPLGVARTLLRWIDWLKIHGWDGQPPPHPAKAPRLSDLARIAPSVLPGNPDRLRAITAALDKRRPDIESIETYEPIDRLLPLWRRIFAKLEARGVFIKYSPPSSHSPLPSLPAAARSASPNSATDLRRALSPGFAPAADGSLTLFRPYNPLGAAESVAAWLRALDDLSDTVVISPSVVLDEALRRFGLPAAGARETANDGPFLQVLPLVLAMGWDPPDPQRALELLLLPEGPVPGFIARKLRSALQQWPAVGSPDWNKAIENGLDKIVDPVQRENIRERLTAIFRPDPKIHDPYPASALLLRSQTLKKWAAARLHASPAPTNPSSASTANSAPAPPPSAASSAEPSPDTIEGLDAVIAQCSAFEKLVALSGLDAFTEPQLLKLNIEIADSLRLGRRYEPQVGLTALASPGALAGPARRVVWWDFTLEASPDPFSLPLSRAELAALESIGVKLTPAAELASDDARRRRRPFEFTSESLLLVCPRFGEDGEEGHHHPIWDEVAANNKKARDLSRLETKRLVPACPLPARMDPFLPIPVPRRFWSVAPKLVAPPPRHSPTSLQDLLGCSFKWALSYLGKLRDPEIAALTENVTLMGNLSHEILAEVLRSAPADGPAARSLAASLFREIGPKLAAPLFLPGAPVQLAFVRNATVDAAAALVDILKRADLPVVDVEFPVSDKTGPIELAGRLDLVAGDPPVIVDLKWGGDPYHRDKLKNGTATQLATYAYIIKKVAGLFPPVAYFIIRNQRMIAPKDTPFADVETIAGPPIHETWDAFLATTLECLETIKTGRFEALAVPLDDDTGVAKKDELSDGRITIVPPCKFCSFGFLCGLNWENAR